MVVRITLDSNVIKPDPKQASRLINRRLAEFIKDQVSLQDVMVKLHGTNFRGDRDHNILCPFHGDTTPSMRYKHEKKYVHCYTCGEGGDIFWVVEKSLGVSFSEAVKWLIKNYGLRIPENIPRNRTAEHKRNISKTRSILDQIKMDFLITWRKAGLNPVSAINKLEELNFILRDASDINDIIPMALDWYELSIATMEEICTIRDETLKEGGNLYGEP